MPTLETACAPEGLRLYAIGDIHGRLDLLRAVHAAVMADLAARPVPRFRVIHLGDYIDRGPDSAGVVEHLTAFIHDGNAVCLRGNHDQFVPDFLADPVAHGETWMRFGGDAAMASWGIDTVGMGLRSMRAVHDAFVAALPARHRTFFEALPHFERHGDYLFVHAGLRPGVSLSRQTALDMMTIREPFLSSSHDFGVVIVHGHTVVPAPVLRPNRIQIDTKAWASGRLTCLVLEGCEKGFLEAEGYTRLPHSALCHA